MKKVYCLFFLCLCVTSLLAQHLGSYDFNEGDYTYRCHGGSVTILTYNGNNQKEIIIPDSVFCHDVKLPITVIDGMSFDYHDEIEKLIIPSTIKTINATFQNCNNIKEVIIEKGEKPIDFCNYSFRGNKVERFYLGREIENYDGWDSRYIFNNLKYLYIEDNVNSIQASFKMTEKGKVIIADSENELVSKASLSTDSIYLGRPLKGQAVYSGEFGGYCSCFEFGPTVTCIPYYFIGLSIDKFVIPKSIKRLNRDAFYESRIGKLIIEDSDEPLSLESSDAFYRTEIDSLYLGRNLSYEDGTVGTFNGGTFMFYKNDYLKYLYISDNVTELSRSEFSKCLYLTSVRLSDNLETLPTSLFYSSIGVETTDIKMPKALIEVGESAFSNTYIAEADFSDTKVEKINYGAFNSAWRLSRIVLPPTIRFIDKKAFAGCTKLKEILSYSENVPVTDTESFLNVDFSTCVLRVPYESVDLYKSDIVWSKLVNILPIEETSYINTSFANSNNETPQLYGIDGRKHTYSRGIIIEKTSKGTKKYLRKNK